VLSLSAATLLAPLACPADDGQGAFRRVLLISIDGMHAVDFAQCAKSHTCPQLAGLAAHGVTYTRASASKPSDSFPGLTNIVTGGTPKTHGAFYDVAFDRTLAPPATDTWNGLPHGTCTNGSLAGTTTEYDEGIDKVAAQLNGGAAGAALIDGGVASIDPTRLPRDPSKGCAPVYPWNFIRVNTIFGVIHAHGGRTSWSDKHPSYSSVNGPTAPGADPSKPTNLDDYYSPEINSSVVGLPGVVTPATPMHPNGIQCNNPQSPTTSNNPPDSNQVGAWTDSFLNIQCYDTLKVNAVLNWIRGKTRLGANASVPSIFGMNFQAVSVGQKLIEALNTGGPLVGGYVDNSNHLVDAATPTNNLLDEIEFVDASIGKMVMALSQQGQLGSTLIIITAKHGQSPIDPHDVDKFKSTSPAHLLTALLRPSENSALGPTEDDVSLLWLNNSGDTQSAVETLQNNKSTDGVGEIFYGASLATMFNPPGMPPAGDPRTPDIIVQPDVGVIYSTSGAKQAEHGGFAHDDTNVMLLVSNPSIGAKTVISAVETAQVAPTILWLLGLNPGELQAVQIEGTPVLPGLTLSSDH
jgi:hypothetical protein